MKFSKEEKVVEIILCGIFFIISFFGLFYIEGLFIRLISPTSDFLSEGSGFYLSTLGSNDPKDSFSVSWSMIFIVIVNFIISSKLTKKVFGE